MNSSPVVATLLASLLVVVVSGCGSDSSDNTSDQPPITVDADFARQSGAAVQNVLAEVARVAKGALLLQGRVRDGAFPSAGGSASPQTAKPAPRAATSGEPCPAITTEFTEDGWIMTLDYGPSPGCPDAFDGVERSGTLTIAMTDLVYDPRYFFPIAGRATLSFADFRIGNTTLSGSGLVNIVSWTLESWDLDLTATGPTGRQDFSFQGIVTAEAERDNETINGSGVAIISGRSLQITASALAYDFDWTRTSLSCDEPVGGSLTLTGTPTATLGFGYPAPGCGFADLTINHGAPDRVSIDETPRADGLDLVIGVDETPAPVVVGEHLTYTVTVFNAGADASGVVLSNLLPSSVRWVSTVASQGACTGALTVTCELGDLPSLGRAVVTIVGIPTAAGWFENMASVTATGDDVHYADNVFFRWTLVTGVTETGPSGVDLVLSVAAAPESILAGDEVTYTLTVTNQGQETATGVVVLETIPYNAQWVSSAATQGSCTGNAPVTCSLGSLDAGAQATVTIVISTTSSYYYGGVLYNSASVSSTVQDDVPLNNTVNLNLPVLTPVQNPSRIEVTPASSFSLGTGSTKQFSAIAYSDDSPYPQYYPSVVWTSSDDTVITVSAAGLATARGAGSATITASAGGVTSNAVTITVQEVQTISLPTNDLVYDPHTQMLLASVPSRAGVRGNTVTATDPATGAIAWSEFVGSEPGKLALSDDGQWLYVVLDGAETIQRFDVPNRRRDIEIPLGRDPNYGAYRVADLEALPGQPGAVAVSRRAATFSLPLGVVIYDGAVARPNVVTSYPTSEGIAFSDSAETLYGFGSYSLQTLSVDSAGVTVAQTTSNLLSVFGADMVFDGGLLYFSSGHVVDPTAPSVVGTFTLSGPDYYYYSGVVEPDSQAGRTYFLLDTGSSRLIKTFDQQTFLPLGTLEIQSATQVPFATPSGSLRRIGADGLAFRTNSDQIVLVRTSPVP